MARIAFVTTMAGFPWGGSEFLWTEAAREALQRKHEVLVVVFDWSKNYSQIRELVHSGARLVTRPVPQVQSRLQRVVAAVTRRLPIDGRPSWVRALMEFSPEKVIFSSGSTYEWLNDASLLVNQALGKCGYAVICQLNSEHHFLGDTVRPRAIGLFQKADLVAFVSEQNRKLAERQLAVPMTNAVVVQNPVNLSNLDAVNFPPQSRLAIAAVARLQVEFKGQEVLLEVLGQRQWADREWVLRLYGSGPDEQYLRSLARFYNIDDRVEFMGHAPDIRSIWFSSHLLVMPSRAEGTPLALVEAMICGRPAVVSDVGGNAEWVKEGDTGFLADAATTRSFGAALERAWDSRSSLETMGGRARAVAMEKIERQSGLRLLQLLGL